MAEPQKTPKAPSELVIYVGGILMAGGMILSVIAISPLVTHISLGSIWWFLAMVTGVGFVVLLVGIRMSAKERTRLVRKHLQGERND